MKTKLTLDATGCPTNLFSFLINNARWMADAKSVRSANARSRACSKHLRDNHNISYSLALDIEDQLYSAFVLTKQGFEL